MKKKFEAVSGDQSLFDIIGAYDSDIYIVKNGTTIFSSSHTFSSESVIAERRPVPKYIPKAGDVFALIDQIVDHGELLCLKSNDHGVAFEYLEGEKGCFDSVSTSAEFLFIRSQSVEKYVPKIGDIVAYKKSDCRWSGKVFKVIESGVNGIVTILEIDLAPFSMKSYVAPEKLHLIERHE